MASIVPWRRYIKTHLIADPVVADALAPADIDQQCRDAAHRWRESFWSPSITVLTFLLQVLEPGKTLRCAVAQLLTQLAAAQRGDLPSADPSAYCQARQRLPGEALTRLLEMLAGRLRQRVGAVDRWLGRRVWVVDGSSASMPDTPDLQQAFPQPAAQAPGCGFPVLQFVALFCWTTGAILDVAIDSLRCHELPLFRKLWHHFRRDDVVLADRAYGSYVDFARLSRLGVFGVFRLHQRRTHDFRAGRPLGPDDRLVTWERPAQWLHSMGVTREEFEQLPAVQSIRLVRIPQTPRGFRSRTIVVATTLLDPVETPADDIRALYRDRWTAELHFRSLKIALGMDVLRGRSRDIVIKEVVMHLVAYNLIRLLMWEAARKHRVDLHRLSFTGTLHRLRQAMPHLLAARASDRGAALMEHLCEWIAHDRLPYRPDRYEPRRVKRRPKQFSRLNRPRAWFHRRRDHSGR